MEKQDYSIEIEDLRRLVSERREQLNDTMLVLASKYNELARSCKEKENHQDAIEYFNEELKVRKSVRLNVQEENAESLLSSSPLTKEKEQTLWPLAQCLLNLGALYEREKDYRTAEQMYRESLQELFTLYKPTPGNWSYMKYEDALLYCFERLISLYKLTNRSDIARDFIIEKCIQISLVQEREADITEDMKPKTKEEYVEYIRFCSLRGELQQIRKQVNRAKEYYNKAFIGIEELYEVYYDKGDPMIERYQPEHKKALDSMIEIYRSDNVQNVANSLQERRNSLFGDH